MKRTILMLISTLAAVALVVPGAQAELITDLSASASSYYVVSGNIERQNPIHVVNGDGMASSAHNNDQASPASGSMWHSDKFDIVGSAFYIDFKQDYLLDATTTLKIWNYNHAESLLMSRGAQAVEFSYAADDGGAVISASGGTTTVPSVSWTSISAQIFQDDGTLVSVLTQADGSASYTAADRVDFGTSVTARYIQIAISSNHGDSNFVGLSEVQAFYVIPEPSTIVLGGLGLVCLTLLRPRRQRRT